MEVEAIRRYCLQFPHVTENVQWEIDLCLKVDGKLFAVVPLEPARVRLSFKCSPENFAELCERPEIIPAPYMARAQWVALQSLNAIADAELRELLAESYRLVFERLPKKRQHELRAGSGVAPSKMKPSKRTSTSNSGTKKVPPTKLAGKRDAKPVATRKKSAKAGRG